MSAYVDIDVNDFYNEVLAAAQEVVDYDIEQLDAECVAAGKDARDHLKKAIGEWSQTEDLPWRKALTYEKGWKVYHHKPKDGHLQVVVANKNAPSLTHLVEKPHRLFIYGHDTGRMTKARPHIKDAYEYARSRHFKAGGEVR